MKFSELLSYETDVDYGSIAPNFTKAAKECFPLDPDAQVALNLVSMVNFFPLIEPVIRVLEPAHVCEIGAYKLRTTRALAKLTKGLGARLSVVDPDIDAGKIGELADRVTAYQETSMQWFGRRDPADVYFLDGDHNYYTVLEELRAIAAASTEGKKPACAFLHDVGWPCAYRDLYYAPDRIPEKARQELVQESVKINPFDPKVSNSGLLTDVACAIREGGDANGIMSSVKAFLANHSDWRFSRIYSLYGLGVLWAPTFMTERQRSILEELDQIAARINPFLSVLELNRILLLSALQDAGELWHRQQQYIKDLEAQVKAMTGSSET